MFVDIRPINRPVLFVASHEVAEQVSKVSKLFPNSVTKYSLAFLEDLIGRTSILASDGDSWKWLRKRFNPGFAPQHLISLLPCIVKKAAIFIEHMDTLAREADEFSLVSPIVN